MGTCPGGAGGPEAGTVWDGLDLDRDGLDQVSERERGREVGLGAGRRQRAE